MLIEITLWERCEQGLFPLRSKDSPKYDPTTVLPKKPMNLLSLLNMGKEPYWKVFTEHVKNNSFLADL